MLVHGEQEGVEFHNRFDVDDGFTLELPHLMYGDVENVSMFVSRYDPQVSGRFTWTQIEANGKKFIRFDVMCEKEEWSTIYITFQVIESEVKVTYNIESLLRKIDKNDDIVIPIEEVPDGNLKYTLNPGYGNKYSTDIIQPFGGAAFSKTKEGKYCIKLLDVTLSHSFWSDDDCQIQFEYNIKDVSKKESQKGHVVQKICASNFSQNLQLIPFHLEPELGSISLYIERDGKKSLCKSGKAPQLKHSFITKEEQNYLLINKVELDVDNHGWYEEGYLIRIEYDIDRFNKSRDCVDSVPIDQMKSYLGGESEDSYEMRLGQKASCITCRIGLKNEWEILWIASMTDRMSNMSYGSYYNSDDRFVTLSKALITRFQRIIAINSCAEVVVSYKVDKAQLLNMGSSEAGIDQKELCVNMYKSNILVGKIYVDVEQSGHKILDSFPYGEKDFIITYGSDIIVLRMRKILDELKRKILFNKAQPYNVIIKMKEEDMESCPAEKSKQDKENMVMQDRFLLSKLPEEKAIIKLSKKVIDEPIVYLRNGTGDVLLEKEYYIVNKKTPNGVEISVCPCDLLKIIFLHTCYYDPNPELVVEYKYEEEEITPNKEEAKSVSKDELINRKGVEIEKVLFEDIHKYIRANEFRYKLAFIPVEDSIKVFVHNPEETIEIKDFVIVDSYEEQHSYLFIKKTVPYT
jgi:hypothetical protein